MRGIRLVKLTAVLLSAAFLTACWDKAELNDRAYVNSIALDCADETGEGRFSAAVAVSDLRAFDGSGAGGEADAENKSVKKTEGETVSEAMRLSEKKSSKKLFFGHTKAVFLGEKLLENKTLFSEALDALERDKELSRKMLILACEGGAAEVIETSPEGEPSIGVFTDKFYRENATGTTFPLSIEELFITLRGGGNAIIPKIKTKDEELVIGGGAVISGTKLAGFLDDTRMRGAMWQMRRLDDKNLAGTIVTVVYNETPVPFTVTSHKRKASFGERNGKPVMYVKISVSGSVDEYTFGKALSGNAALLEIERLVAREIKEEIDGVNVYLQSELSTDALNAVELMRKTNYSLWEKHGGDNKEIFEKLEVAAVVSVSVKSAGIIR